MTIHWHKRAAAQLHQVEDYVLRDFGERIRQEFMDEVEQAVLALAEMPTMGKLDPADKRFDRHIQLFGDI